MLQSRFGIDNSKISHDRLEGEVIVVDLESGSYYCLTNTGADVWTLLVEGYSGEEAVQILHEYYLGDRNNIEVDVKEFIKKLIEFTLLFETKIIRINEIRLPNDLNRSQWFKPKLDEYNDMWDLIKMDPIHESNEELGWPEKKSEN